MTKEALASQLQFAVPPLRMRKPDGTLYGRPKEIEASLVELYRISRDEVAERSLIRSKADPGYVPSECVMHFVRQDRCAKWPDAFGKLFQSLRQRLLRALWAPMERTPGESEEEKVGFQKDVRDFAMDHFLSMLCSDKSGYDERLDHFECRFNQCIRADRVDAQRKVMRRPRTQAMPDEPPDALAPEFGGKFAAIFQDNSPSSEEIAYRNEIVAAINSLPDNEREVIRLVALGYSNVEIARHVNCAEKTVYNRRKRGEAKIAEFVDLEGGK